MEDAELRQQAAALHEQLPAAVDASLVDVEQRLAELLLDYELPLDAARRGVVSYYLGGEDTRREGWSNPDRDPVEVLLLGSDHVAKHWDEILGPERQREFEALSERLAAWHPDGVATEFPEQHQAEVNAVYEEYRDGERAYDGESEMGPFNPYTDEPAAECRSEAVQIGFRLADRLDHERVYAVDYPMTLDEYLTDEEDEAADEEAIQAAASELGRSVPLEERWEEATVVEFLQWLHREEHLRSNERSHLAMALVGADQQYVGAKMQTAWYDRNLRMVENLWRAARREDLDRVLLVAGFAHVHVVRRLLSDAPTMDPVDPRPVLAGE
jgi:hypothetical protein